MGESARFIADIIRQKADQYELGLFHRDAVAWLEGQLFDKRGQPYLKCLASGRDRRAYPEEIVRQLYVKKLMDDYGYPAERIQVERPVFFGSGMGKKRADIVVVHADDPEAAYVIVEVKKPNRHDGVEQLKSYCNAEGSPIAVWTNGGEVVILHRVEPNLYRALTDIPNVHQTLEAVAAERVTLVQLTERDKLVTERLSLKDVILDLENLVLANAGVDAFEEVFKLIYAKLYDEWFAARPGSHYLQFRVLDDPDEAAFYNRINSLFNRAKDQWPGVFLPGEKIDLTPGHLATCVSFLQDIKLFNSNLQVIDEAFEYLMTEVGKGKKGQYFTPRHVIDMAVKMLNPTLDEYVADPACGSCGFTMHAILWVWREQLNAHGPQAWQRDYAATRVYGLDFDARAVKIAQAVNLIAGDGRTNVYRANTLAPYLWDDKVRVGLRDRLRRFPDPERDRWNQEHYRYFDFDLLMTNPPFAGDIGERRILHQYELARRGGDRLAAKQGRDILFIERNLEFLRPGGRMAIVLPQGRFNNTTDAYIREFVARECRILAVVGLDVNTFKPHTGTKTSLLFLQKWNDDSQAGPLCPRVDDYPIFFATSKKSGKDNSGQYVYQTGEDGSRLLDAHGHLVVDHDLDDIAAAFVLFAKEQGLSFWSDSGLTGLEDLSGLEDLTGLEDLSGLAYTRSSSLAWASERLDAEYYQPKYYGVLDALRSRGPGEMLPLGEMLTTITNGHTPRHHDLSVGQVLFLTAEFVDDFRIDYSGHKRILHEHHENELQRTALREGDLLVTIKGRIGNAAVVAHLPGETNINQDVALLRLKKGYHPYYVAAFLNSEAGKALTDQVCTGQINPFLGLGNLKTVLVPIFETERMNELGDKVKDLVESAYHAQQEARRLLEEARRRVEELVLGR